MERRETQLEMGERPTNLVEDRVAGLWEGNRLLEVIADLLELLALGPVVEGAGNIHLFSRVRPAKSVNTRSVTVISRNVQV